MKKINEIFYSLQGEGYYVGKPAVFIRFSGCNLKCDFCDTQHQQGKLMEDTEIIEQVLSYTAKMIVLTGGEPSLQIDNHFLMLLHQHNKYVCIETNGIMPLPDELDWITCSPKAGTDIVLTRMDELKLVYQGQDITQYEHFHAKHFFLQPCSGKNIKETVEQVMLHPMWRLSLQTQKLINIR